eukprot:CAMPEP_0115391892 /NCGR_PEP_ID=MMETSP0271-20121206/10944_1 /TAXON_ID=71861 /ORGANISM="Scrippsiella trochoidea, Strain CCMP3099" /LENGTH=125 /DNA_ID=CAMNT_0002815465 /DNA_START=369 /DNA_END=747 /DNA_ORIENTATION=+
MVGGSFTNDLLHVLADGFQNHTLRIGQPLRALDDIDSKLLQAAAILVKWWPPSAGDLVGRSDESWRLDASSAIDNDGNNVGNDVGNDVAGDGVAGNDVAGDGVAGNDVGNDVAGDGVGMSVGGSM